MGSKAFEAIKAGLEDALAHLQGKKTGGRLRRVYVPDIDVAAMRAKLGLSQGDFASAFGVSVATVRNWEQGRRRPDGPARVLLAVVDREPEAVLRALDMPRRQPKVAIRDRGVRLPAKGRLKQTPSWPRRHGFGELGRALGRASKLRQSSRASRKRPT